jgi:hypothetical protein
MDEPDADDGERELVDEELVEVFRSPDEMGARTAVEEILNPAGIPAMVHDRVSHRIFAPASLPGAYFVAVPVARETEAKALLREAIEDGALPGGEIAGS